VQAQGARSVQVRGDTFVGGSVQIVQGRAATIKRVSIIGDLLFDGNSRFLEAIGNRIGGKPTGVPEHRWCLNRGQRHRR